MGAGHVDDGHLALGATVPTPYTAFELKLGDIEWKPAVDSFNAPTPVPVGVDDSGNVYALGAHRTYPLLEVFELPPGGTAWRPLGMELYKESRGVQVRPNGDLYTYAFSRDVTHEEAVYRRRAP